MNKPKLFVITTNYNWESTLTTRYSIKEILAQNKEYMEEGDGPNRSYNVLSDPAAYRFQNVKELEERIIQIHPHNIIPCIEISRDAFNIIIGRNEEFARIIGANAQDVSKSFYAQDLMKLIALESEETIDLKRRMPKGTEYIDLIVKYPTAPARFDLLIDVGLSERYEIKRFDINRPGSKE